ncbi:hypothetical protein [Nostoc sp.]|uniref:hypothetical protein n=1 Tax=Nostoc sp. TaxID=1180 RepID=UPI002D782624|nr:hypothetical protein [Nostoc sp.]
MDSPIFWCSLSKILSSFLTDLRNVGYKPLPAFINNKSIDSTLFRSSLCRCRKGGGKLGLYTPDLFKSHRYIVSSYTNLVIRGIGD